MPPNPGKLQDSKAVVSQETLADGRYVMWRKIASGAQADTLEGVDRSNGRPVAIKRFRVNHARSWKDVELAEREARVLSSLNHPALPAYVDHFEENGALYLVMDLVEGQTLAALIRAGKRLGLPELRHLMNTLADVLEYIHSRVPPVIHRDIKPANIIVRPDGTFSLVDFGSVRDGLRPEGGSTVVGTFGYMAPEQFQGRALPASDVYAVGALVLSLLTGRGPDELPHRGLSIDVDASLDRAVPSNWIEAIRQMTNIDPDQRPSSLRPILALLDKATEPDQAPFAHSSEAARNIDDDAEAEPDSSFTVMVGSGLGVIPFVILTVARVALWLALGVLVPTILWTLALFFGAGLRRAARRVSEAGRISRAHLANVSGHIQRAEPFVLQGRRYRRRARDGEGWRMDHKFRPFESRDWRHRVRFESKGFSYDSSPEPEDETAGRLRPGHRRGAALFHEAEGGPRDGNPRKKHSTR